MKKSIHALKARVSGLTLVELVIGLGVLGILVAVAVPYMGDLLEKRRVIAATNEVAGILTYAKAETNSTNAMLSVRFDPDPNNTMSCALVATIHAMPLCRCYYPTNSLCPGTTQKPLRLFQLPNKHVTFSAAASNWGGPINRITFQRDQMTIAADGFHVDVIGKSLKYALRVEVGQSGRVKICSPNTSNLRQISGYATC